MMLAGCGTVSEETAMEISVYDSGKADAVLFETSAGFVLMDTGLEENGEALAESLKEDGVESIYALIITHFDKDHVGGAAYILENFDVKYVYESIGTKSSDEIESYRKALEDKGITPVVVQGDESFYLGGVLFSINGPEEEYEDDSSNNSSLITMVTCGDVKSLWMGDAETDRIKDYMEEKSVEADLLKVPYHGHYQKVLKTLVPAVSPQDAVITNSDEDPDEDEIEKTVEILEDAGADVYETKDGTIRIHMTSTRYTIQQE